MKSNLFRKAMPSEFDQIYLMGSDVWAEGSEADYLQACRNSSKYTRGTWYVLENELGEIISSLIIYNLSPEQFGIGSIATLKTLRKQGYATKLISEALRHINEVSQAATVFLYSDISPEFYERFGFIRLPLLAQRYKSTTCMALGNGIEKCPSDKIVAPEYF
jgi:predicted N-acetyltransferase YhbS